MKIERTVTSISWIPSESTTGVARPPDEDPHRTLRSAAARCASAVRPTTKSSGSVARRLPVLEPAAGMDRRRRWTRSSTPGTPDGGRLGSTTISLGPGDVTVAAVALPDDPASEPEFGATWVRFTQTVGGRTGWPLPRPVKRPPFVRYQAPIVWTTLQLTDPCRRPPRGQARGRQLVPAPLGLRRRRRSRRQERRSRMPRSGWRTRFGERTPWGEQDSPATRHRGRHRCSSESCPTTIMRYGRKPKCRPLQEDATRSSTKARTGDELYLLLDGVVAIDVERRNGCRSSGPGAVLGERAILEGGLAHIDRCAVCTRCRAAKVPADAIDLERLAALAARHHRVDTPALPTVSR